MRRSNQRVLFAVIYGRYYFFCGQGPRHGLLTSASPHPTLQWKTVVLHFSVVQLRTPNPPRSPVDMGEHALQIYFATLHARLHDIMYIVYVLRIMAVGKLQSSR